MIPTLAFGRTGHVSSRTLFGAASLGRVTQEEADRTLDLVDRSGVNHIDTAASYGESELRLAPFLAHNRERFFLATKTGERTYQGAHDQIRRSLERMRVSQVDLIQLHNLAQPEEWDVAMGPDGALRAAIEAREEGLVRFIGVTGHGLGIPKMHLRSLERFDFDSVLLPYNYVLIQNAEYAADFEALVAVCKQRNVAVQTIKSITRAPWGDRPHTTSTWYEPLQDQADIDRAVHWVLGRPGIFLNTVGDIHVLPKVLDAANRFQRRPSDSEMSQVVKAQQMEPLFV
ncbi:MAG TPA: aldo/keto reductase [Chloroflexota bacterium]|nr:aldo/keto reductase [Chloroflexota bacterium]